MDYFVIISSIPNEPLNSRILLKLHKSMLDVPRTCFWGFIAWLIFIKMIKKMEFERDSFSFSLGCVLGLLFGIAIPYIIYAFIERHMSVLAFLAIAVIIYLF